MFFNNFTVKFIFKKTENVIHPHNYDFYDLPPLKGVTPILMYPINVVLQQQTKLLVPGAYRSTITMKTFPVKLVMVLHTNCPLIAAVCSQFQKVDANCANATTTIATGKADFSISRPKEEGVRRYRRG